MEQLNRMSRPISPVGGQSPAPAGGPVGSSKKSGVLKMALLVVSGVLFVGVLVSAFLFLGPKNVSSEIKSDKYQAVFLNSADGQVYFGKLKVLNSEYYKLTDIYYVRVEQVQPTESDATSQNISLAKLGNEIHGPEDAMYINKDDVMFWENLKDDGQVVTAIKKYIQDGGKTTTPATTTPENNATGANQ